MVTEHGVKGDRQADHKNHGHPEQALCLYAMEVIQRLQAEGHPIGAGSTGENITVAGLNWERIVPGVRLRLGSEVVAEVTGYATPCWKNARWFADGDFERMSHESHPGEARVYARVLKGGALREGDIIVLEGTEARERVARIRPTYYRWPQDFGGNTQAR
jgi:MOSC domain-containing protein YiiM